MITAQLISDWATGEGPSPVRYPKIYDDYTLRSCRTAAAVDPANSFKDLKARRARARSEATVAVVVECEHDVWEKIQADPDYRDGIHWYQEDGKGRRVLGVK